MVRVETIGLCWYEITGDRETEAAAELERRYDFLSRSPLSGDVFELEVSDARQNVAKKYGVQIAVKP